MGLDEMGTSTMYTFHVFVRNKTAYIFHKLDVGQHKEIIEDIVHSSVCTLEIDWRITNPPQQCIV